MTRRYWKSLEERADPEPFDSAPEFAEEIPAALGSVDRRSFLKAAGFSLAAAAGCSRNPVDRAIPYLVQPEQIVPGRAYWMASTCGGCSAGCGVLVKCRDGRPIKLEGNPEHPVSRGGLCARGQASILALYDSHRLRGPIVSGTDATWDEADRAVARGLDQARARGGRIRVITSSAAGPTESRLVERLLDSFPAGRHLVWDSLSSSAILDAHERTHGARLLPRYRFDRAGVIVAFDADFLGTWISPVEYTAGWAEGRRIDPAAPMMSWHIQVEPRMSLTGSNADVRIAADPETASLLLRHLARAILGENAHGETDPRIALAARKLRAAPGRALVVSGSPRVEDQILVNAINAACGAYGTTVDLAEASLQKRGDDRSFEGLLAELASGEVDALFFLGVNPVYDLAGVAELGAHLSAIPLVVSTAAHRDETSAFAHVIAPAPHFLESWSDAEPLERRFAVIQPAIAPIGGTRSVLESLAAWSGAPAEARDLVREAWRERVHPRIAPRDDFAAFWDRSVHDGFAAAREDAAAAPECRVSLAEALTEEDAGGPRAAEEGELRLVLHPNVGMDDGAHAHNPWLHELPDPIAKVTWDNCAALAPATAARLGIAQGDVVRIDAGGRAIEIPAILQPGTPKRVIAIPLGYGRLGTERFADAGPKWLERKTHQAAGQPVGVNAALLAPFALRRGAPLFARISATGSRREIACTQMHHTLSIPPKLATRPGERREIVEETTLAALVHGDGPEDGHHPETSLWPAREAKGRRWAMAIDLSLCTGCSGCVVACQAENNVPVVGKDEVLRQREMHWIRIDRYYSGEGEDVGVVHQPMLCHHCNNAPCETVCPVLATVHGSEGLNQQVYNRCVGTRYCANNCPYKTRRFNWFDYPREDRLQNLVLNPDVTVRSRGVMEKCSFCVQRIEEARIESKRLGRPIEDGEVQPACRQSCPSKAIVFGDANDPSSAVSRLRADRRHAALFAELNVDPGVGYLARVWNRDEEETPHA